jgi:hypothetical protein
MFKLDEHNGLIFRAEDLKEVYAPIVTQFGFEYDAFFDRDKKGLVWTKCYDGGDTYDYLWPTMIIRETRADPVPSPEEATYFSTSLYLEDTIMSKSGYTLYSNEKEFGDGEDDEIELFIEHIRAAKEEVNEVLEQCRQQLACKLMDIQNNLIADGGN